MAYLYEAREKGPPRSGTLDGLIEQGLYVDATWVGRKRRRDLVISAEGTPEDFVYDLASITKPFTASVALWCASRGWLDLGERVYSEKMVAPPTLADLLRHLGGARAWWPIYADRTGHDRVDAELAPLEAHMWPGARGVYSDLGYLAASRWIEHRTRQSLLHLLAEFVAEELDGVRLDLDPVPTIRLSGEGRMELAVSRPSPCTTSKEVELAAGLGLVVEDLGAPKSAEPQDGNARWLARRGLLAGHAGLFGTARAVQVLVERWLRAARGDGPSPLDQVLRQALTAVDGRLLGWQTPTAEWGLPGGLFGHLGFTGGAIWADPQVDASMVLLAHRAEAGSDLQPSRRMVTRAWHRWATAVDDPSGLPRFDW